MTCTRQNVSIVARVHKQNGFVRMELRSFGNADNIQRQCSTGELEFDRESKKFVCIHRDTEEKEGKRVKLKTAANRRPFDLKTVEPSQIELA